MMQVRKLIQTDDGSSSVYDEGLRETYHSTHGAIRESRHVFIGAGLEQVMHEPVNILEIGFGTGLNALLALEFSVIRQRKIIYDSLEAFPLDETIIQSLNYPSELGDERSSEWFNWIHSQKWDETNDFEPYFTLRKHLASWMDHEPGTDVYDLIFYDAFAPSKQPEMWEAPLIFKACQALKTGGIFVTYSARGQLKRDLSSAGMDVRSIPGPPGKKEMVRAVKV